MTKHLYFLDFFSLLVGVLCEAQLVESGGHLVQPDKSLRLSYKSSGLTFTDQSVSWVHQASRKVLEEVGVSCVAEHRCRTGSNSRDASKNVLYLQMNSLRAKDTALYYCAKGTVRGRQCEPRQKPPCRDTGGWAVWGTQDPQVCVSAPGAGAEGGEGLVSCQGLGLPLHVATPWGSSMDT
uniref:Immunoglobulin V-set domain-containing protein n=1 Tax=Sus scrofa TaxID=9823 RepID=A0A8D1UWG6_PIG